MEHVQISISWSKLLDAIERLGPEPIKEKLTWFLGGNSWPILQVHRPISFNAVDFIETFDRFFIYSTESIIRIEINADVKKADSKIIDVI